MTDTASGQHLEILGDLAGLGYFRVDEQRTVVEVSAELLRMTGLARRDVLGKPCISLMRCPDCLKNCGVFSEGRVNNARVQIYRGDGSELQVIRSGIRLQKPDGSPDGALETVRLLGDPECGGLVPRELDILLSGLGRMFIAADDQLGIRAFSPSLIEATGWSKERLLGSTLADLFGEELFGALGPLRTAVTAGKRKEGWHAALPDRDGGRLPVSISIGALRDVDRCGHPDVRVVVMIRPAHEGDTSPELPSSHGIVGNSPSMQRIFRLIDLLRDNDATVLITGESGTGKELIAHAIHNASHRKRGPFVAVNCAALPAELLESELFGHVRGAFTGAIRDRAGRFELANGGTLFLDEIADLAPALQAKILRALQERTFERVGDTRTRTVDVRIIAATHVNLARAVTEHRFREDLYYRLRVIPLEIPPLRDRREDLPALISTLLVRIAQKHQRSLQFAASAMRVLLAYDWPGNVREMENAIEYAVTVCSGQTIHVDDLPPDLRRPRHVQAVALHDLPETDAEREPQETRRLRDALIASRYDRAAAARLLGVSRTTLWRKMKELGL